MKGLGDGHRHDAVMRFRRLRDDQLCAVRTVRSDEAIEIIEEIFEEVELGVLTARESMEWAGDGLFWISVLDVALSHIVERTRSSSMKALVRYVTEKVIFMADEVNSTGGNLADAEKSLLDEMSPVFRLVAEQPDDG